jgi:subtilisin family serine protease
MKVLNNSTAALGMSLIALTCSTSGWAQSAAPTTLQLAAQALATTATTATTPTNGKVPPTFNWMSADVSQAWNQGFYGQGTTMTFVDDFVSNHRSSGNMGLGAFTMRHGEWTAYEAALVAPLANVKAHDYYSGKAIALVPNRLNILNASYGYYHSKAYATQNVYWGPQELSMIAYAKTGKAVVSKAAGNDGVTVSAPNSYSSVDGLNVLLKGAPSAILVGALWRNGATNKKAELAWYSNKPGNDPVYQNMFLTVGVESDKTALAGTSFAAPIVSGYAAILGSKFKTATPTAIVSQLLTTARKDTIRMYDPSLHGRGEASLSRALAPAAIQ